MSHDENGRAVPWTGEYRASRKNLLTFLGPRPALSRVQIVEATLALANRSSEPHQVIDALEVVHRGSNAPVARGGRRSAIAAPIRPAVMYELVDGQYVPLELTDAELLDMEREAALAWQAQASALRDETRARLALIAADRSRARIELAPYMASALELVLPVVRAEWTGTQLKTEILFHWGTVHGLIGYALMTLLSEDFGMTLRRCLLPECERFFVSADGRVRYCTKAHQMQSVIDSGAARKRRSRAKVRAARKHK